MVDPFHGAVVDVLVKQADNGCDGEPPRDRTTRNAGHQDRRFGEPRLFTDQATQASKQCREAEQSRRIGDGEGEGGNDGANKSGSTFVRSPDLIKFPLLGRGKKRVNAEAY